jgi:hypothetical protein
MITRPIFMLALRPEPRVDGIRALRGALKVLGRRFGLRCTGIQVYESVNAAQSLPPPVASRHGGRPRRASRKARAVPAAALDNAGAERALR